MTQSPPHRSGRRCDRKATGDRVYFVSNRDNQQGQGWFYRAREGTFGPFRSKEAADRDLKALISAKRPPPRERYRNLWLKLKGQG